MELKVYIHDIVEGEKITQSQIEAFCELTEYLLKVNVKLYYMCLKNFSNIYKEITSDDVTLRKRFMNIFSNKKGALFEICEQKDNLNCEEKITSFYYFDKEHALPINKKTSIGEFISKIVVDDPNYYCFILIFQNSIYNSVISKKIYENNEEICQISFVKDLNEIERGSSYIYPKNAQTKPTINQTILRNKKSIKKGYFEYENYIMCLDTLHVGESAHLEVYSLTGNPLGTTSIHKFELIEFTADKLSKRKAISL